MSRVSSDNSYDARIREVFGKKAISDNPTQPPRNESTSGTGTTSARPACEAAAGAFHFLTGEEVVHGLLNMPKICDPDRWLKRHKAPVALDMGHSKRFLACKSCGGPLRSSRPPMRGGSPCLRWRPGYSPAPISQTRISIRSDQCRPRATCRRRARIPCRRRARIPCPRRTRQRPPRGQPRRTRQIDENLNTNAPTRPPLRFGATLPRRKDS